MLLGLGLSVLAAGSVSAQSYCPQVREAVATYGYDAVKQYALAHYSRAQIRAGEQCLRKKTVRRHRHRSAAL